MYITDRRNNHSQQFSPAMVWNSTGNTASDAQELAFNRNLPPGYAQSGILSLGTFSPISLSPRMATGNFCPDSYFAEPTSSQHQLEACDTTNEDETDKESQTTVESSVAPTPKRKRGRPKLNRRASEPSPSKNTISQRVPHNQVERKYRQMLNAEMERLRISVPTLPQHDGTSLAGPPKPSKATVLTAAVDYIKMLEVETERLTEENEVLKS
jgi:hypothetical protein